MVYVLEKSYARSHQENGVDKEYEQRYRGKDFRHHWSNNDIYTQAVALWKDGDNIDLKLSHEQVPKTIKITGLPKKARLRDGFRIRNGLPLVSDPLRDLIERFDPGVHDFFPVDLTLPAGRLPDTGYSVFILRAQKDTFIPELSNHGGDSNNRNRFKLNTLWKAKRKVTLATACLEGAHFWREERLYGDNVFLSDEFEAAMRSEGIRYYNRWRGDVVDVEV